MPEGDVLARTATRLGQALNATTLTTAQLRWPSVDPGALLHKEITETFAYGKNLFQRTADGWTLHTHLRMDGSWRVARAGSAEAARLLRRPNARAVLGNERWLCAGLELGMLTLVRTRDEHLIIGRLGPNLLDPDFLTAHRDRVAARMSGDQRPICDVLLDQSVVAGIGTIYMAESLFAQRLWPWTPAAAVTPERLAAVITSARTLMLRVALHGFEARVSHVHGRYRRPCHQCGTPVACGHAKAAPYQRPVFYCPTCQAAPAPGS